MAAKPKPVPTSQAKRAKLAPAKHVFVKEYLIDMNATQAAIRCGYSPKTAKQQGSRLLTYADVQEGIAKGMEARNKRTEITADRVLREIAKVGFATMRHFLRVDQDGQPQIDLTHTDHDNLDALAEVSTETVIEGDAQNRQVIRKTKIKLHDKLRALQLLAEHTGVFKERDKDNATALAKAFADIWSRGSKAPLQRDEAEA